MQTIGPYRLLQALGTCQVGGVWSAVDASGQRVTMAVLSANAARDPKSRGDFATVANELAQSGQVPIIGGDYSGATPWVAASAPDGSVVARVFVAMGAVYHPLIAEPVAATGPEQTTAVLPGPEANRGLESATMELPTQSTDSAPEPPAQVGPGQSPEPESEPATTVIVPGPAGSPEPPSPQPDVEPTTTVLQVAPVASAEPEPQPAAPPADQAPAAPVSPPAAPAAPVSPPAAPAAPGVPPPPPAPQPAPSVQGGPVQGGHWAPPGGEPQPAAPAQPQVWAAGLQPPAVPAQLPAQPAINPPAPPSPPIPSGPPHSTPTPMPPAVGQLLPAPRQISAPPLSPQPGAWDYPYGGSPGYAIGPASAPPAAPRRRWRTWLLVGVGALVLVALGGVGTVAVLNLRGDEGEPVAQSSPSPTPGTEQPTGQPREPGIEPPIDGQWPAEWPHFDAGDQVRRMEQLPGIPFAFEIPADWECTDAISTPESAHYRCGVPGSDPQVGGDLIVRDCPEPCDADRRVEMRRAEEAWGVQWVRDGGYFSWAETTADIAGEEYYRVIFVGYYRSSEEGRIDRQVVFRMSVPADDQDTLRKTANSVRSGFRS